jgi:hypothetical protein
MRLRRQHTHVCAADGDGADLQNDLNESMSAGQPLPPGIRHFFESTLSRPLDHVRIIANARSAALAHSIGARAFTLGRHIWFGQNEYRPMQNEGRQLLAHELAHTLQQGHHRDQQALQGALTIGRATDPAEAEADRFAGAVVNAGEQPRIRQRDLRILREARPACTVSSAARPNQRNVDCGGRTYRATVDITTRREPETRTDTDLGINDTRIWLDIEICRGGTEATITPSVNLPAALMDVVRNIFRGASALEGVSLSPELEIEIARSERFRLSVSGGPTIDPLEGEVTGGQGGISLDTRLGRFSLGARGRRGGEVTGTFTWTPGDTRPERRDCSRRVRRLNLTCERIRVVPAVAPTPAEYGTQSREVYLLFPYAQSTPVQQILMRTGSRRPRPATATEIAELGGQGFRIDSIEGFASPEGPREPSRRRRFVGNQRLSQARAEAAQQWVSANCPACERSTAMPVGRSELFSPGSTPEVEGRPLAEYATETFLQSEDPLGPGTEAQRQSMAHASLESRRDSIYPLLRRAVIVFNRRVLERPASPGRPRQEIPEAVSCPREVRDAVRRHLGL